MSSAESVKLLRELRPSDLVELYRHSLDEDARRMCAFTQNALLDRRAFDERWTRQLADPAIRFRAIDRGGAAVGYVASFARDGVPEVCYWLDKAHWGRGLATAALRELLALEPRRPIYGRVAFDNLGSIRVLEKCGFTREGLARRYLCINGVWQDHLLFARLKDDPQP